jgi:multisubunit Na+/H+ antiporter MnhG subunit
MNVQLNKKQWQIIGGSIILIAAVTIVLPALLNFAFALGRLIITIGLILLVTFGISVAIVKYKRRQEITTNENKKIDSI